MTWHRDHLTMLMWCIPRSHDMAHDLLVDATKVLDFVDLASAVMVMVMWKVTRSGDMAIHVVSTDLTRFASIGLSLRCNRVKPDPFGQTSLISLILPCERVESDPSRPYDFTWFSYCVWAGFARVLEQHGPANRLSCSPNIILKAFNNNKMLYCGSSYILKFLHKRTH